MDFERRFPGLALCASTLPSLGLLQCVQSQCKSKAWTWIPWKRLLSEEAALDVQARRATRKRDMVEVVAEAAGLCSDEWDLDLSASPYKVQTLLSVRAHAYAMSEAGHLHSWMSYVNKFMLHYTRRPGLGLRPPSPEDSIGSSTPVGTPLRSSVGKPPQSNDTDPPSNLAEKAEKAQHAQNLARTCIVGRQLVPISIWQIHCRKTGGQMIHLGSVWSGVAQHSTRDIES